MFFSFSRHVQMSIRAAPVPFAVRSRSLSSQTIGPLQAVVQLSCERTITYTFPCSAARPPSNASPPLQDVCSSSLSA